MKKKVIVVLIVMLLFSGVGIGGYWHFFKDKKEDIVVGKNQELIVAQISEINGNEITYTIANEVDFSEIGSRKKENFSTEENRDSQGDNKDTSGGENFGGSQSMPKGKRTDDMERQDLSKGDKTSDTERQDMPIGEMPNNMGNRNMPEGEIPNGLDERNMPKGEMPNGMEQGTISAEKENSQKNKTMYTLTGEEETTLIPVGTIVTTQLGTTTTFSLLAAGDMVKLLVEKDKDGEDVIVGIWMI